MTSVARFPKAMLAISRSAAANFLQLLSCRNRSNAAAARTLKGTMKNFAHYALGNVQPDLEQQQLLASAAFSTKSKRPCKISIRETTVVAGTSGLPNFLHHLGVGGKIQGQRIGIQQNHSPLLESWVGHVACRFPLTPPRRTDRPSMRQFMIALLLCFLV